MNRNILMSLQAAILLVPIPFCIADDIPEYPEHQDLSYYISKNDKRLPIDSTKDWQIRRKHILHHMQTVMGPLPNPKKPVDLDMKVLEQVAVGDSIRQRIIYHTHSANERVTAYLFTPNSAEGKRVPAILCLHQTTSIGKAEPAGFGPRSNLHYALHLARRGYVTLAPDYPSFGDYKVDFNADEYISGTMRAIYDNIRAVDLLQSLPVVDAEHIGCIGHSLGGHNTMFTAAFETRIKAMVSNCGFTRFHKYYNGRLQGWTSDRYMPLIREKYRNDPNQVPFDFTEIVASFAPRPFLASAPVRDGNFEVSGVRDVIKAAKTIYQLHRASDNLKANYPDSAHDFPTDARKVAYEFFDRHLKN